MTFSRANPLGWALYEVLTSAQMNAIDLNVSRALDGYGGGDYSPSSPLKVHGKIIGESVASRKFLYPLSCGQPNMVQGSWDENEWFWEETASKPIWRARISLGYNEKFIRFDLNRFVPQGVTITLIRAYMNQKSNASGTDRMYFELSERDDTGDTYTSPLLGPYYCSAGVVASWATSGAISVPIAADKMYWVTMRSNINGDTDDRIRTLEITYTEGNYLRVP